VSAVSSLDEPDVVEDGEQTMAGRLLIAAHGLLKTSLRIGRPRSRTVMKWLGDLSPSAARPKTSAIPNREIASIPQSRHVDPIMRVQGTFVLGVVILALSQASPLAERLPIRTLTTADGLPRDQLQCVRSDARGFLWFCTPEGLVRFDGQMAVTFGREQGLDPARIRSFLPATGERYFVGADGALFAFHAGSTDAVGRFTAIARDDGRQVAGVNALAESRDRSIWCATGNGLLHLFEEAGQRHLVEVEIGLPRAVDNDLIVRSVREDERGMLWIGTTSGLYARRPDGHVTRLTTANGLPADDVLNVVLDDERRLWAATRQGLVLLDRDATVRGEAHAVRRVFTERDGLLNRNVRAVHPEGSTLWIATRGGIVEATLAATSGLHVERNVGGFTAWDITTDQRGDVWAATESGARRIAREGFTIYTAEDGLPATSVSSLFETSNGDVCATTLVERIGLSCFDGHRFRRVPVRATAAITDVGWGWSQLTLQDRRGGWWIPTGEGVLRFAPGPASSLTDARPHAIYTRRAGLRSDNIFRLFEDSRDGIWVATYAEGANGLARVDVATGALRLFGPEDGFPGDLSFALAFAEDRSGAIWVGFDGGRLLRYRGRFEDIPLRHGPPGQRPPTYESVSSILVDHSGRVWITSTDQGLGRVEQPDAATPAITWYGKAQGLSSDTASVLVEDVSGDLLVGTGRGVDRVDPDTGRFTHYSADEGVPRGEIQGALRDRQGRIWLATTGGVALLNPRGDRPPLRPTTLITGVRVAGMPLSIRADGAQRIDAFTVQPGDGRIEIDFVTPGARGADGLRYQHWLEGVDQEWTTTDARTVALAGAAPGYYRFLVRSILANGVQTNAASVEFIVLAPVWRRGWFIALVVLGTSALAFAFHRARVRRAVAVERVRSEIAADLHDGVGASLSRIAILSDVVKQQAHAALPDAMPALTAIGDNARAVIDDMSDAVWFIDPRLDNLQQVVARLRALASELFAGQPIGWTIEAPTEASRVTLTSDQRRHIYLMLKESLTNVLRHAKAAHVAVRITTERATLRLEVSDDGIGLNGQRGTHVPPRLGGRGIDNLYRRAALLGGTVQIVARDPARGTSIIVEMPVSRPHVHAVGSV
jgi:ligand-binding sensor domain-containing protein/signal transduction histidine kinase